MGGGCFTGVATFYVYPQLSQGSFVFFTVPTLCSWTDGLSSIAIQRLGVIFFAFLFIFIRAAYPRSRFDTLLRGC